MITAIKAKGENNTCDQVKTAIDEVLAGRDFWSATYGFEIGEQEQVLVAVADRMDSFEVATIRRLISGMRDKAHKKANGGR